MTVDTREQAAMEPGYERLQPYRAMTFEELQAGLSPATALLLVVDRDEVGQGLLVIRATGAPAWLETDRLAELAARTTDVSKELGQRNGYRRGPTGREAISEESQNQDGALPEDLSRFWTDQEAAMREAVWDPVLECCQSWSDLPAVEKVIGITHGTLHSLPLSAGQPEGIELVHYPGLVFYHLHGREETTQALEAARAERGERPQVDLLHHGGDRRAPIPMVGVEARAIDGLWSGQAEVANPSEYPQGDRRWIDWLHVACHGVDDPTHTGLPALWTGNEEAAYLGMAQIQHGGVRVQWVYINACIGGRTVESPLDGTPSGLLSAFFRQHARVVIGALVLIPDVWAGLLAVLVHQAHLNEGYPLERALGEGKRRLASGQWYADTAELLRPGIAELLGEVVNHHDFYDLQARKDESRFWANMQTLAERWGIPNSELQGIQQRLRSQPREQWPGPITAALTESWLARRPVPPQPALGTLLHGVVAYGESL